MYTYSYYNIHTRNELWAAEFGRQLQLCSSKQRELWSCMPERENSMAHRICTNPRHILN